MAKLAELAKKLHGRFIVLDGPDGSGKSTQLKLLADDLNESVVEGAEAPPPDITKSDIRTMKKEADVLYDKYPTVNEAYNRVREETKKIADLIVEQG